MKKITTIFLMLLTTSLIYSQTKVDTQTTHAEQFSATAGTLIEKQFIDIGFVKGISVQVMKIKDLKSGASKTALRFDYENTSNSFTKTAILDYDEIDGFIEAMKTFKTVIFKSTRDIYTEVTFTSRTGFEAGAYYDVDKAKWVAFLKLEKAENKSQVFFNTDEFLTLLILVEQAKTKM